MIRLNWRIAAAAVAAASGGVLLGGELESFDSWGGIEAVPAVVNPVIRDPGDSYISLRGEWTFSEHTCGMTERKGPWAVFYSNTWERTRPIRVPGVWEAQGVGSNGMSECWFAKWDSATKPLRAKHMGEGWYRREVDIPEAWAGKRIWLKVGGVQPAGWFFVNDEPVAWVENWCGTYKYDITDFVKPGESTKIVVCVDNRRPSRKGLPNSIHRWGGIVRDIELEATEAVRIDDVWARGDFDGRAADVHVEVGGGDGREMRLRVDVGGTRVEGGVNKGETVLRVPLRDFRPWSPETPNLYTAKVELVSADGKTVQTRFERFGVRKLEVRGKEFYLNGRPYFFRGFGDDCVYPLDGFSPADRKAHLRHLRQAKEAGFNFVRLHTHCEQPEYFEAADEVGMLVQIEMPYYFDTPTEQFEFDPVRDLREVSAHFRRHPSWAVLSNGNEGWFGPRLDNRLYALAKELVPDRLKINQDSYEDLVNLPGNSDYRGGFIKPWPRGAHDHDRPFVCHEYLNLCVKLDARDEDRYTGAWQAPVTRADRRRWLRRFGLGCEWDDRLQNAQHALQRHWQQAGLESARADPHCDGYCFWTIVDVAVRAFETYSAQGLFNPFWDVKCGGFTPAEFRRFNGETVLLADSDLSNRVAVVGESVPMRFLVSHYGADDLPAGELAYRLDAADKRLVAGSVSVGAVTAGPARQIGAATWTVPAVERPVKAVLTVEFAGCSNRWDWWIFPKRTRRTLSGVAAEKALVPALARLYDGIVPVGTSVPGGASVVIASAGSAAEKAAIAAGKRVLSVSGTDGEPDVSLGWWWMGSQVGTALRSGHPVFGRMPVGESVDGLLFRTVRKGALPLPLKGVKSEDLLAVGEGGERCGCYLALTDGGKTLRSAGLALFAGHPETDCLLDGFVDYLLAGERPKPAVRGRKIVAFGDSITEGVIGIRPEENWLRLLQGELGDRATCVNAGVGGNSAREAMARFERDVLAEEPDVVLVEFGGNNHDPTAPARQVPDDEFRRHLERIRTGLPAKCRAVAVVFPPIDDARHWCGRHPDLGGSLDRAMESQRNILREFARANGWPVVDLYALMAERRDELLLGDGVHLNPKGQLVFAEAVLETLTREGLVGPSRVHRFTDCGALETLEAAAADGFTLEFAVKVEKEDDLMQACLFSCGEPGKPGSWHVDCGIGHCERRLLAEFESADGPIAGESAALAINDGKWHQVAFAVGREGGDGMRATLYLDGKAMSAEAWRRRKANGRFVRAAAGPITMGARGDGKFRFRGKIADVRYTPRTLGPAEFQPRFTPAAGEMPLAPGLQYDTRAPQWKRQRTTRRYLHGPMSERMMTLWIEGKVILGEIDYGRPMKWSQLDDAGAWLVHGKKDRPFAWREAKTLIPPDGIPLHAHEYRAGDLRVRLEAVVPFGLRPSAGIRVTAVNEGAGEAADDLALLFRSAKEKALVFSGPDVYNSHNPAMSAWLAVTNEFTVADGALYVGGDYLASSSPDVSFDVKSGALRFPVRLGPKESRSWTFTLGRDGSPRIGDFAATADETARRWRGELRRLNRLPKAIACDAEKTRLVKNMTVQLLQCICRVKGEDKVLFRQGGLSRCIWPWESRQPFQALAEFGDFNDYLRPAIDLWFGELQNEQGEIDTRRFNWVPWASTTGACLDTFSRHALATGDAAYFRKWRDRAMKAYGYVRDLRHSTDGKEGLVGGLFPPLGACDWGEPFQCWGFTDIPNLEGVEAFAEACERFADPAAEEVRREARDYRAVLDRVMERIRRESAGGDEMFLPVRPDGLDRPLQEGFYPMLHHGALAGVGFLTADDLLRVRRYMLRRGMAHPIGLYCLQVWTEGHDWYCDHGWYTTVQEYGFYRAFRRYGMDELASDTLNATLRCSMTKECYMTERYWDTGEWYVPWSPNASGNGRLMLMLANSDGICLEDPDRPYPGTRPETSARFALPPRQLHGETGRRDEAWAEK